MTTPGTYKCIAAASIVTGQNCTNNGQCVSGLCRKASSVNDNMVCTAKNQVAVGGWCAQTGANSGLECVSGAFCSANSTVGANPLSSCVSGSYRGLTGGSTCWNDDQCVDVTYSFPAVCRRPDSNPVGPVGICNSTIIGMSCNRQTGNLVGCTQTNGATGIGCYCTSAGNKCALNPTTPADPCPTQLTNLVALSTKYPYSGDPLTFAAKVAAIAAGTADATTAGIYACCRACNVGITSASSVMWAQTATLYNDKILQCATTTPTYASYGSTDATARCNAGRSTVTGAAFGTCPPNNTGAGVSVLPSLALIVAIVAALLSLFA
jgi:hypothetical protein